MKNKLKGITLLETIIYIGLFSVIILLVFNFMLATQEASIRTDRLSQLQQSSLFITQHISHTMQSAQLIDIDNSVFLDEEGKLTIEINGTPIAYELIGTTLLYDSTDISPNGITVESFYLEPIYKDTQIIAVSIQINIYSNRDPRLTEEINFLGRIR